MSSKHLLLFLNERNEILKTALAQEAYHSQKQEGRGGKGRSFSSYETSTSTPLGGDFGGNEFADGELGEGRAFRRLWLAFAWRCFGHDLEVDGAAVVCGLGVFLLSSVVSSRRGLLLCFLDAFPGFRA